MGVFEGLSFDRLRMTGEVEDELEIEVDPSTGSG